MLSEIFPAIFPGFHQQQKKKKIRTMQTHLCHISYRNLAKNIRPISHVILVVTHQYPSLRHIS